MPLQRKITLKVASSLVAGQHPGPELIEQAVHQALTKAGLSSAEQVILLLSREFSRNPQAAILAAARAAGTTQVSGCTTQGVFTEDGWQIDQAAVAVLVFNSPSQTPVNDPPIISLCSNSSLPFHWQGSAPRAGLLNAHGAVWHHARIATNGLAEIHFPGLKYQQILNTGLHALGKPLPVEEVKSYELRRIGNQLATDCLIRKLPAELREHPPWHHISLLRSADTPAIAILSANADGSLALAAELREGEIIQCAIRQPLFAEQEIQQSLNAAVHTSKTPNFDFAMMLSCIGRGPLFYGDDDRDLLAFRKTFPDTPLIGGYGSGQIAFSAASNHLFNNTAVTLLCESVHV
jgi:small ligand-binding sensory domain FIST